MAEEKFGIKDVAPLFVGVAMMGGGYYVLHNPSMTDSMTASNKKLANNAATALVFAGGLITLSGLFFTYVYFKGGHKPSLA